MKHTSYFTSKLTDDALWQDIELLLQEYSPDVVKKHTQYLSALEELNDAGGDAQALDQAYRSEIISDALFAFQKGMEANWYHFRHPQVPSFAQVDFEDMYQEWVMMNMPKRLAAEKNRSTIEMTYFRTGLPWCEVIREYIIDLEVTIPKLMHFEGYMAGNQWFKLTVPGYQEDQALTSIYQMQLSAYFGK
jgi:hypothetical protein